MVLVSAGLAGCLDGPGSSSGGSRAGEAADDPTPNAIQPGNPQATSTDDPGDHDAPPEPPGTPEPPWVGAWLGTWPTEDNRVLESFHRTTNTRLDVVDLYVSWEIPPDDLRAPMQRIAAAGAVPLVTWQPTNLTTVDIANGSTEIEHPDNRTLTIDAYLDGFASVACETSELTGAPVLVRPMGDANGDWHPWSIGWSNATGVQPNTPASYRAAWEHVHARVTEACPEGVEFIWSINHVNIGNGTSFTNAYPGNETVDHVGISGFNWGAVGPFGWQSFDAIYSQAYCNVTAELDEPILLTALGTAEAGGDKAAWIRLAHERVASGVYDVEGIVWFDATQELSPHGPIADLRITSSHESQQAFTQTVHAMREGSLVDHGATWDICEASG